MIVYIIGILCFVVILEICCVLSVKLFFNIFVVFFVVILDINVILFNIVVILLSKVSKFVFVMEIFFI